MVRLPDKIDDPILEAGIEIRFRPNVPHEVIYGVLYQFLKETYPISERLPILQIPEEARSSITSFQFLPYYRLRSPKTNYVVQIGAMLSVFVLRPYKGWNALFEETKKVFSKLREIEIGQIQRCSLKYVDVFDGDVFTMLNLSISAEPELNLSGATMRFQSVFKQDEFACILQLSNDIQIQVDESQIIKGSLLDLEVIHDQPIANFFERYPEVLNKAHQTEKRIFFGLLKEQTLHSLNPVYND
jgi:uncharacterized protein (TIGR04255 family)